MLLTLPNSDLVIQNSKSQVRKIFFFDKVCLNGNSFCQILNMLKVGPIRKNALIARARFREIFLL